ncbi:MAG: glycosyltransferase family 4 protein [Chloroflexaceae bacterium]|nr:glycosyltransferase family 4 protein [Chloroflexaceae bacterium]
MIAWSLARHMLDVDVIYATFGDHKLFVGYFCKRIVEKPLVVTIHAYELYDNPNPRLFLHALNACDQIITVTDYNREYLRDHFAIDPARVEVVRCGLDIADYRPEAKFTILIVSFFVERKGHDILFRAIKQLDQEDIEVWVVGGEGTETTAVDVRGLAKQLGIESRVAFFGKQSGNALKAMYRACDVFCLPCRTDSAGVAEGFPVVIMEAMAMGKPVITSRHVEIPRIVKEIIVAENDVDGLAQAIRQVYESRELRQRLAQQNRVIAEHYFPAANARKTVAIMQRLAGDLESETSTPPMMESSPTTASYQQ